MYFDMYLMIIAIFFMAGELQVVFQDVVFLCS